MPLCAIRNTSRTLYARKRCSYVGMGLGCLWVGTSPRRRVNLTIITGPRRVILSWSFHAQPIPTLCSALRPFIWPALCLPMRERHVGARSGAGSISSSCHCSVVRRQLRSGAEACRRFPCSTRFWTLPGDDSADGCITVSVSTLWMDNVLARLRPCFCCCAALALWV